MTIRFNPPPGWPMPPATWVPHDEWLPDPDWPEPPADWTFWTATPPRRASGAAGAGTRGRGARGGNGLGRVSFPIATVAAQSTVSLAALFPERGRSGGSTNGYGSSAGAVGGTRPVKAGREYYQPRGSRTDAFTQAVVGGAVPGGGGSNGSGPGGSVLDGAGGVLLAGREADETAGSAGATETEAAGTETVGSETAGSEAQETVKTPGIRLSPILRLVSHPSGLRVQFRVGGPVAAALADVMTPAIEAATPGLAVAGGDGRDAVDRDGRGAAGGRSGRSGRSGRGGGLRRLFGARQGASEGAAGGGPVGAHPGQQPGAGALSIHDLAQRALAARREADRDEALAVEQDLCSLHRQGFTAIRPPAVVPFAPVSPAEESVIRDKVLAATGGRATRLPRAESAELRALATERAVAVVRASNVARRVFADRRAALSTGAWQLLEAHDPAAVVAVVDEALRRSGSDVTCLDAGTDPVTLRGYVTVLVRFPTIGIVAEEQRELGASGRSTWRPRTARERNTVYAAGLASAVLAAAKHVVTVAPATDDVNVVVVRPTRNGRGVEPVYVGRLDREDVSLRHPDADPQPLVTSSAVPHGIRVHGADREVTALEHAADVDGALREIVDACRAADARGRTGPDA